MVAVCAGREGGGSGHYRDYGTYKGLRAPKQSFRQSQILGPNPGLNSRRLRTTYIEWRTRSTP